jgi:hypothetical protein
MISVVQDSRAFSAELRSLGIDVEDSCRNCSRRVAFISSMTLSGMISIYAPDELTEGGQ